MCRRTGKEIAGPGQKVGFLFGTVGFEQPLIGGLQVCDAGPAPPDIDRRRVFLSTHTIEYFAVLIRAC